jgi:hypothetical protein
MARSSVSQPLAQGGLGVVDVSCKVASLRAVWLRRFFSHCPHPWTVFFNFYVSMHFGQPVRDYFGQPVRTLNLFGLGWIFVVNKILVYG